MPIEVFMACVTPGRPGEPDEYEAWFRDTESEETSATCAIEPTGDARLVIKPDDTL